MAPVTCEKKGEMGYQTDLGMNDENVVVENVDDHQIEKVQSQAEMAVDADEVGDGNAATEDAKKKKNRKKKEKKAAAATTSATPVAKPVEKKVPKHVMKMQEELAKLKEAEERKKREEEEKLKKEEEEFLRQEELERIKQEEKRLRKVNEKIKREEQKKKEEEEQRVARRNQLIPKGGVLPPVTTPTKRPIYTKKKRRQQANGEASSSNQLENNVYSVDAEEDVDMGVETAEEDITDAPKVVDVDERDAMSWDDIEIDLQLPPVTMFSDEDKATEPEPITKRETKESQPAKKSQQGIVDKGKTKVEIEESETTLRSPICCVMGHVDAGKTKLLDSIKRTNVQKTEAGGITQQISATYIPTENIRERTKDLKADAKIDVAGLLVIDTPGHESFNNLRSRGSSLCDVAILVVDITNGLQPQTIESIKLLKMKNTDVIENDKPSVVVALNKVDRLYGWKTFPDVPIVNALKQQSRDVQYKFKVKVTEIITQFKEQGVNTELFYKNKDRADTYSIVPTSAISGQGIPELLLLLVQWAQKTMIEKLTYKSDLVEGTVMEVKVTEGLGTTIDVILVNGVLHKGDEIGPIHTTIRSLLTPRPVKELHTKGDYIYHKEIKAAQVIKITAQNLDHAVAGTALYVVRTNDDLARYKKLVMEDMKNIMSRIDKNGKGVYVQASTLGSLEAFIVFLNSQDANIPVGDIGIGPVHRKDVLKANELEVKIFTDDVIFQLFSQFKDYYDGFKEEKKINAAADVVYPCVLKANDVFVSKKPIILGVEVLHGTVKLGTPICIIPKKAFCYINGTDFDPAVNEKQKVTDPIDIGRVTSIRINDRDVNSAQKGQQVSIKIDGSNFEFKKDFKKEGLCSHISRNSIDVLKEHYLDELSKEERVLINKLKKIFKVL
ncbi:eukaryotic translation initiation factor 5B-like protein [Tanacetum coccineum]